MEQAHLLSSGLAIGSSQTLTPRFARVRRFGRVFARNKTALIGAVVLMLIYLAVIFAPFVTPYDPDKQRLQERFSPPSLVHPFGTDQFGRDIFSRVLYGGRVSLSVGLSSVAIALTIGVFLGLQAGFLSGWLDGVLMRFTDSVIAFPTFFLMVAISTLVGPSLTTIILVIGLTAWPGVARLVRGQVLSLKERDFVTAAIVNGCNGRRIMLKHLLPNTVAAIIVAGTLEIAFAVLTEAALSFLGVGVRPPQASWGNMLTVAQKDMFVAPWVAAAPGFMIFLTVLCLNFVGDGLRDSLDPRLRHR